MKKFPGRRLTYIQHDDYREFGGGIISCILSFVCAVLLHVRFYLSFLQYFLYNLFCSILVAWREDVHAFPPAVHV